MKKLISVLCIFLSICSVSIITRAADSEKGYSVAPVFSEHQTPGIENFFDIKWTPSSVEKFSIVIKNNTNEDHTYKIEVNKARTNKHGMVDYSDNSKENDNVTYKLTNMIEIPKSVEVKANDKVVLDGSIKIPDVDFNGILMAGIHISEFNVKDKDSIVSNSVAYNIPFVLRGNNDNRPNPILTFDDVNVEKFSSEEYRLDSVLSNKGPNLMKDVKFISEIKDKNNNVIDTQNYEIDITPETTFVYPIKLPSNIKKGDYTLHLSVDHGDKDKWDFQKKFSITDNDVKKIKDVSSSKRNKLTKYIYIVVILLIIIVCFLFYWKNKLKRDNNKNIM